MRVRDGEVGQKRLLLCYRSSIWCVGRGTRCKKPYLVELAGIYFRNFHLCINFTALEEVEFMHFLLSLNTPTTPQCM